MKERLSTHDDNNTASFARDDAHPELEAEYPSATDKTAGCRERKSHWRQTQLGLLFLLLLGVLLFILVWSFLPAPFYPQAPEIVVAWGDTGGTPAVAAIGLAPEPMILLTGSPPDCRRLAQYLKQQGSRKAAVMVMPTGAPYVHGAKSLLRQYGTRKLLVLENPKSRIDGKDVWQAQMAMGTGVECLRPSKKGIWQCQLLGDFTLIFQRQRNSTFSGEIQDHNGTIVAKWQLTETGEFILKTPTTQKAIPKSNRSGIFVTKIEGRDIRPARDSPNTKK